MVRRRQCTQNNSKSMKIDEITNQIVLLMGMSREKNEFFFPVRINSKWNMSHGHIFTILILTHRTSCQICCVMNAHIWAINKQRFYLNGYGDDNNGYCYNKLYRMTEAIQFFDRMELRYCTYIFVTLLAKVHTHKEIGFLLKCLLVARTSNTEILNSKTIHRWANQTKCIIQMSPNNGTAPCIFGFRRS